MRKRVICGITAAVMLIAHSNGARASFAVEQVEAFEIDAGDNSAAPTRYAPVDFAGASQITLSNNQLGGYWNGITFHGDGGLTATNSNHAYAVGQIFYGKDSVAYSFVTDVYNISAPQFLKNVVNSQDFLSATGPLPGHFEAGVKVIDNAYVGSSPSNLDSIRRLDFMINRDDVTFVAAAANTTNAAANLLSWSAYNSIAVSGQNSFITTYSPAKKHADLSGAGLASFTEALVAGYAAGLFGNAQTAGQSDALHGIVNKSLLMAGADKTSYTRDTANNLSLKYGAGQANYGTSLAILTSGEKPMNAVVVGGNVTGVPSWSPKGWSYGNVAAGSQSTVLFHSDGGLAGLTASLNWNVDQPTNIANANQLNTLAGPILPSVTLDVRPITYADGQAIFGVAFADVTLHSAAADDNVQYLYFLGALPSGDYAFVITGDAARSTPVGFAYTINESSVTAFQNSSGGSWGSAGNWPGPIPNSPGATASFVTNSSGTNSAAIITLDGNRTVGQLTFDNSAGDTISPGSSGILTLDNNGARAVVTTVTGSHTITAPVILSTGATIIAAINSSISVTGAISGIGGIISDGPGTVTISGSDSYGDTAINRGTFNVSSTGTIASSNITIAANAILNVAGTLAASPDVVVGGTLHFSANPNSGILTRVLTSLTINGGAAVTIANPAGQSVADRTLLVTNALSISGLLDLAANDLIVHSGNFTAILNAVSQGSASSGIWSSTAAANAFLLTALAAVSNDNNGTVNFATFDGQSLTSSDVIVKYTYYGDANLDGMTDAADLVLVDNGFTNQLSGWQNGDFNYDGFIDGSDYSLIDNAMNMTGGNSLNGAPATLLASTASEIAPVPEPSAITILLLSFGVIVCRRPQPKCNFAARTTK